MQAICSALNTWRTQLKSFEFFENETLIFPKCLALVPPLLPEPKILRFFIVFTPHESKVLLSIFVYMLNMHTEYVTGQGRTRDFNICFICSNSPMSEQEFLTYPLTFTHVSALLIILINIS